MKSKSKFQRKINGSGKASSDTSLVRNHRSGVSKHAKGKVSPTKRKRK